MKKPPPGMKSMPVKPGETKSQYMDRVRATKPTGTTSAGPVRGLSKDPGTGAPKPRVGGGVKGGTQGASKPIVGKPTGGGRGRGGMTPPPGMMYGPNDALIPIPKKGDAGTGGGRGTAPRPGYSGGKPKVSRTPIRPGRPPGFGGMKSGGMVKGKK